MDVSSKIKVLDCTLRDGAYIVNGNFGEERINGIIETLNSAGVDIIELGWLKDFEYRKDCVFFDNAQILNKNSALMFDYGKYNIDRLAAGCGIIRIAFYKNDLDRISFAAEEVKNKGYKVFLQASNTIEYTDNEVEKLCKRANFIGADAVYLVDSFGSMFPEDLDRIASIFDDCTHKNVEIGFHSHNNIQLSFALTIQFINRMNRNIIVDSSLCGLGRGVGNTQTELLLEYLKRQGCKYNTEIIWDGIKKYIEPLYEKYSWKYTPERAYRGIKGLHPNTIL